MPTRKQFERMQMARMLGFNDDDRIGRGGFEAPNGRQWWEPERRLATHTTFAGKLLGYFLYDFEAGTERYIDCVMLEDFTDTDDQDWHDFNRLNKLAP